MATYTGTFNFYNSFKEYLADGTIDIDDTTAGRFKVLLCTSTYTPSATTHTVLTDITNELSGTGGYARQPLTSVTWVESGGTVTWDAADVVFSASGANFDAAYYWVLYDDTSSGVTDALIAYGLIDNSPASVTVTDGNSLTLQWNGSGLFTLS